MKEKTKKYLVIGGLLICAVGLVVGIGRNLYREQQKDLAITEISSPEEVIVDEVAYEEDEASDEITESSEVNVPDVAPIVQVNENGQQSLQKEPEIPGADEVPAPEFDPSTEIDNPDVKPIYAETPVYESPTEPQNGERNNGQIYVMGFGWIEDEGGGCVSTEAEDKYENGNKVGMGSTSST